MAESKAKAAIQIVSPRHCRGLSLLRSLFSPATCGRGHISHHFDFNIGHSDSIPVLDALSAQAVYRLISLENILSRLIEIANKELTNQTLSEEDYEYIRQFAQTLEWAVIDIEEKGLLTTLVADVHTHTAEANVLKEAVGYVDLIIVACPSPEGSIFLAAGPVLSYYEFKHPMSDRLTDEAWQELLDSPDKPERPTWYLPLIGTTPKDSE